MSVLSLARSIIGGILITLPIFSTAAELVSAATESQPVENEAQTGRRIKVAVLMPSDDSPILSYAKIIGNGILAANRTSTEPADVIFVGSDIGVPVNDLIRAAMFDGADVVIGPLTKNSVTALAKERNLPMPVVTLNTPDATVTPEEISEFLLLNSGSTASEADFVAEQAVAAAPASPRMLIIRTAQSWQIRVANEYKRALTKANVPFSEIVIDATDPATMTQLAQAVTPTLSASDQEKLFLYSRNTVFEDQASKNEAVRKMRATYAANSVPPFSTALLAVDAQTAGLVRSRLPKRMDVWGTSSINPGDPATNASASSLAYDLNKVHFVDAPMLVNYSIDSFEEKFHTTMPYSAAAKRLFALGADTYHIAAEWAHARHQFTFEGESGFITVDRKNSAQADRIPVTILIEDSQLKPQPSDKH